MFGPLSISIRLPLLKMTLFCSFWIPITFFLSLIADPNLFFWLCSLMRYFCVWWMFVRIAISVSFRRLLSYSVRPVTFKRGIYMYLRVRKRSIPDSRRVFLGEMVHVDVLLVDSVLPVKVELLGVSLSQTPATHLHWLTYLLHTLLATPLIEGDLVHTQLRNDPFFRPFQHY